MRKYVPGLLTLALLTAVSAGLAQSGQGGRARAATARTRHT